jgi:hypothetical protein
LTGDELSFHIKGFDSEALTCKQNSEINNVAREKHKTFHRVQLDEIANNVISVRNIISCNKSCFVKLASFNQKWNLYNVINW